ncbi:Peroxiredoxin [uncultured archaeon]|nr:Peroxiredoxin [uncultured archaeon]
MSLQVGQKAPVFKMQGIFKGEIRDIHLEDYAGKYVVLFFYPGDFTFVCPTEVKEFSERADDFAEQDAQVLGVSVDSVYAHKAWIKELGELRYPLLSDITKEVGRSYGILIEEKGITLRGAYIIDPEGVLRYQVVHDLNIGRSVDEILRVLKALQTGEMCPVEWRPGKSTLGKA